MGVCGSWQGRGGVAGSVGVGQASLACCIIFCFGNKFLSPAMRSLYATLHLRLFRMGASCWSARRTAILYRMVEYRVEACCDDMAC